MVAKPRRHLPKQPRDLHPRLKEAEDVIDEQKHVTMFVVSEVFRHRQRSIANPKACAGRLIHLPVYHHHVFEHVGILHAAIQLLPFATSFADSAEDAHSSLMAGHIVDHLGQQDRLADPGAPKQSCLSSLFERHEHIDRFDTRFEDLGLRQTVNHRRRSAMHTAPFCICRLRHTVDGMAEDIERARNNHLSDRDLQWFPGITYLHSPTQPLSRRERDPSHPVLIHLLHHFNDNLLVRSGAQHGKYRWQPFRKLHVDDTASYRENDADIRRGWYVRHKTLGRCKTRKLPNGEEAQSRADDWGVALYLNLASSAPRGCPLLLRSPASGHKDDRTVVAIFAQHFESLVRGLQWKHS